MVMCLPSISKMLDSTPRIASTNTYSQTKIKHVYIYMCVCMYMLCACMYVFYLSALWLRLCKQCLIKTKRISS